MFYTAESVSPKHPDKICDRISDAILDECLRQDENSRVAIETMGGHGIITITGELTTNAYVDIRQIVKRIAGDKIGIQINIEKQSPDIAFGIGCEEDNDLGAGDQGIMIGYACNENEQMIPQELYLARKLCKFIYNKHQEDGKTQITINDNKEIIDIVCSFANIKNQDLKNLIWEWLINNNVNNNKNLNNIHTNPAGDWKISGFDADTGLTGRKIVVDAYGPRIPVGGGAYSGKDASKVDRSAAYMARKLAIEILQQTTSKEVLIKVAYGIGLIEPIMIAAEINGEYYPFDDIQKELERFKPQNIIDELDLKKPIYEKTAEWGAYGNDFIWDKI